MAKGKYRLRIKPTFLSDLDKVLLHIADISGSKDIAMHFYEKINAEIINRQDFAEAFERFYPYEGSQRYYRIYIGSYTIFYTVRENVMEVRRLIYSGADYGSLLE